MDEKKDKPIKWWEKREEPKTIWQACKTKDGLDYYYNSISGETSWEKPEELMTPEELDTKGEWNWIPDQNEQYVAALIVSKDQKKGKAKAQREDGSQQDVDIKALFPLKRSSLQRIVADLVLLDDMTPPLILHNLRKRYEQGQIYTNVGTILISVNPYQILPLYTKAVTEDYINRGTREMPPHVYNIAHDAYWGMKEFEINQSIIISGESGAGKTEATKQCLSYLAASAGSTTGVEKLVLQSNPILEAFGNAKTLRNDNSSRFGKFIQVYFDNKNQILSASIENYLLEKIRVIQQTENERNFHIFYQIAKGADAGMRKKYNVGNPNEYDYIKGCTSVDTIDDVRDFKEVVQAMADLKFSADDQDWLFGTTTAVLQLGNIQFSSAGSKTDIKDKKFVTNVANLLKVDVNRLIRSLTIRELRIRGQQTTEVVLDPKAASDIRDALAKFVYGAQFDWLVKRINKAMALDKPKMKYIGILDIFGFEIFKRNSFEQLCINFTNEMLQQHFNQQTFKLEEAVYTKEKIKFTHVAFIDNQPMIELITKKPDGIMPLLDEELRVPKGDDKTYIAKLHNMQGKNRVYKKVLKDPNHFIIKHYAGEVIYDTAGFMEKNRDTLTTDLLEMLESSKSAFINILFKPGSSDDVNRKESLGSKFLTQLRTLMAALNATEPHYIRCIKPNDQKKPQLFMSKMSFEQLTYSGVFEAVAIRKQGFPFRLTHEVFAKRYECINTGGGSSAKDKCLAIKKCMNLPDGNFQMGLTMALYRAEEHRKLELARSVKLMQIEINNALEAICQENWKNMNATEKEDYFTRLARHVRQADEFRLQTPNAKKARELLEQFVESRMDPETKRKLEEAKKTMAEEDLEAALAICDGQGYRTKLTRECRELLDKVKDAEGALAMASREMEEEYLNKALAMCDEFKYNRPSAQEARQLLNNIVTVKQQMTRAMQTKDHVELENALNFADSFEYRKPIVDQTRDLYRKVMECRRQLEAAKAAVRQEDLEAAMAVAAQLGYSSELTNECQGLLDRVTRVNAEVANAMHSIDEEHVRVCVFAADELGMTTQWIEYFRTLVRGEYAKFLEAQYSKAIENKEVDRAIRIFIKRKDVQIAASGQQFVLDKYPQLKDRIAWAKQRFFGLAGSLGQKQLEERASHFIAWQKDKLHSLLCKYALPDKPTAKLIKKKLKIAFENIQKHMGQRKSQKTSMRVRETLADGLAHPPMRTEFYIYLLKQMARNPEPAAVAKAWDFLALALNVFPPSSDFENYLEYYFRLPENAGPVEKYKLKGLLRRIVHHGQGTVPSEGEIDGIASYMGTRSRGFTDPPYSNPTYTDLMESYYGGSPYSGAAAVARKPGAFRGGARAGGGGGGGGGGRAPSGGPSKWKKEKDPASGNFYYVNQETGQSQWDEPAEFKQPAPAAAPKFGGGGGPGPAGPAGGMGGLAAALAKRGGGGGGPAKPAVAPAAAPKKTKWTAEKDPDSGDFYFINLETMQSTWDRPADYDGPDVPVKKKSKWQALKDPESGDPYYFNEETGVTTWDKPADFDG